MAKFIALALMAACLLLSGCNDDGGRITRADVRATRTAQHVAIETADARAAK